VPRSRMSGAIPPLAQYAFMAWCSVKAEEQLYLYLYLYPSNIHLNLHENQVELTDFFKKQLMSLVP